MFSFPLPLAFLYFSCFFQLVNKYKKHIACFHSIFWKAHTFTDGQGRLARCLGEIGHNFFHYFFLACPHLGFFSSILKENMGEKAKWLTHFLKSVLHLFGTKSCQRPTYFLQNTGTFLFLTDLNSFIKWRR